MFDTWSQILHVQRELLRKFNAAGTRRETRAQMRDNHQAVKSTNSSHEGGIEKHLSEWTFLAFVNSRKESFIRGCSPERKSRSPD